MFVFVQTLVGVYVGMLCAFSLCPYLFIVMVMKSTFSCQHFAITWKAVDARPLLGTTLLKNKWYFD